MKKNSSTLVNKNTINSLAIGGFDGMHKAHQELFKNLDKNGAILVIDSGFANLTPKPYRQGYTTFPIYYYELENIRHLSGSEFIKLLQKEFVNLEKIVVGFDFHFGKDRKYNSKDLKDFFKKDVVIMDEFKIDGISVHSKNIRAYLREGNINLANKFLGKQYKISGTKIVGQGLGKKSFVPTINLKVEQFLLPNEGVYITKTILDGKEYNSVSFLGHRISTDGNFGVETHILEPFTDSSSQEVQIKFVDKIRDNKKFDSFDELKKQILKDIEFAKLVLEKVKF